MNSIRDHLIACVGEEGGEIAQVVGKAQRFGLFDMNPKTNNTNWRELDLEVHDLIAVMEMLYAHETGGTFQIDRDLIDAKKDRVLRFMGYAREVGCLEPEAAGKEAQG